MSDESLLFLSSTLQQFATCSVVKWLWPPIFTCSGLGYLPLCIHSFFLRLTSVSQLSAFLLRFITPTASLATLLYAIQHFACSLSKFTNHFACYLCLNQRRSRFYDFVFASSIQSTHSEMDFNELYFSLFDLVHTHILPLLSSSLAPLCACEASIIHHSASFVSFSINRLSPSLLRPLRHTPDMTETNQVIRNSWLFLNAPKLRDFLQNTLLANSSLLVHAASSLLLFVYALVAADVLLVSMYDDANATTLQFNVFLSLIQLVNAMENSFKQCKSEAEYRQRVVSYQPTLNAITTLLGEVSINLLQYPTLKPLMSLLVIQLMKWVVSNDNNVLYDLAIHQLIKIARYSVIVCKKQLYSVLPDCIVGELAKSLLTVSTQRQDSIIHSVFDNSINRSDFYLQLSIYILPVYINQQDVASIVLLTRAIFPEQSVSTSLATLFQGDRCVYSVFVYLLKHMNGDNMKAWELFFFLQSSFTDEEIESGAIVFPQSSKLSLLEMVKRQGHCVLWPLLFDCTSESVRDREISETALKSLCELYESDGGATRTELLLKSFHYFNFQINQALSFNQYDLERAILALKRSLDDYKGYCENAELNVPDNFLWGVLSFVKNVLQVGALFLLWCFILFCHVAFHSVLLCVVSLSFHDHSVVISHSLITSHSQQLTSHHFTSHSHPLASRNPALRLRPPRLLPRHALRSHALPSLLRSPRLRRGSLRAYDNPPCPPRTARPRVPRPRSRRVETEVRGEPRGIEEFAATHDRFVLLAIQRPEQRGTGCGRNRHYPLHLWK